MEIIFSSKKKTEDREIDIRVFKKIHDVKSFFLFFSIISCVLSSFKK